MTLYWKNRNIEALSNADDAISWKTRKAYMDLSRHYVAMLRLYEPGVAGVYYDLGS